MGASTGGISGAGSAASREIRSREDFCSNLCPQFGWGQQKEAEVVSSCNGAKREKYSTIQRLQRKITECFPMRMSSA